MVIEMVEKLTDNEITTLDEAVNNFFDIGHSMVFCPRCGNEFDFHRSGSSYQIKCKTPDCLKMTSRGI